VNAQDSKSEVFDVFLCHNSEDKPAVREISQKLVREGIKPWLDEEQIRPGTSRQTALEQQIESISTRTQQATYRTVVALIVGLMSWLMLGLISELLWGLRLGLIVGLIGGLEVRLASGGIGRLRVGSLDQITLVENMGWNWYQFCKSATSVRPNPVYSLVGFSILAGLTAGLIFGPIGPLNYVLMIVGLLFGVAWSNHGRFSANCFGARACGCRAMP
jgi:TIR domain